MAEENKTMQVHEQEMIPEEGTERIRERATFIPRTDIYETEESMVLVLDMPGVNEESIDITLEKNVLRITGISVIESPKEHTLAFAEYMPGDYERNFRVTDKIDRDGIEAVYRDGILRLTLPKAEELKVKKISIKTE
jgi:HSP20 family molecular chaperone IbpA